MSSAEAILREGETCWRRAVAPRMAVIIDAAEYFKFLRTAILNARHSILLIGWDFDARIALERDDDDPAVPVRLGQLLSHMVRLRRELHVHVLRWDLAFLKLPLRGSTPLFLLDWMTSGRLHFKLDTRHPPGGCHHQKILVIDDTIAFCGGIDVTVGRWDTRAHYDREPRRVDPRGHHYPPWHDVTTAVDGEAARCLGELARQRWCAATRQHLAVPPRGLDNWPDGLVPQFRSVSVAFARTYPKWGEQDRVREVEALVLAAISAARRTIYIESQYFASHQISAALQARLGEKDGPDIIIVAPRRADGWLGEEVMGSARTMLLDELRNADRWSRLRFCTPVTESGSDIYVHAKVLVIDDRLLRIGSSNMNNRSMGLDSECDLAIEAPSGAAEPIGRAILNIRDSLLCEHLGVSTTALQEALSASSGSLAGALDRLARPQGRTLRMFEPRRLNAFERDLARTHLLDPDHAEDMDEALVRAWRLVRPGQIVAALTAGSFVLGAAFVAWRVWRDGRAD